jgi:metal-responsive CopG/Arc/MetJ family transcriptional regulator
MARTTKVLGFSVPPEVVKEFEAIAQAERRTKSDLFREMFRVYKRYRQQQAQYDEQWVMNLIREVKEEQEHLPMTEEEMLREEEELAQYGAQQTEKLDIRLKDIDRLIHEFRTRERP